MTLEEFKRPFTEAELRAKFEKEGFEESLWEFCVQANRIEYDKESSCVYEPNEGESDEDYIAFIKEDGCWSAETMREEVWNYAMDEDYISAYLSQRNRGHGHVWSFIYSEQVRWEVKNPVVDTYIELKSKNATEAKHELEIFVDSFPESKNTIFKKALTDAFGESLIIDKDVEFARGVAYQYDQLLASGCKSDEIYNYAKDLANENHDNMFYRAYMVAIENNASSTVAYGFAHIIEDFSINDCLLLERGEFTKKYKKVWQREFYYTVLLEDLAKQGEPISTINKNSYREQLGLAPVEEPLTYEDEEYLRINRELIESGVNEFSTERKAYEAVFEPNMPERTKRSAGEQFKQDIINTMFPNQEDYQDYLDGEI